MDLIIAKFGLSTSRDVLQVMQQLFLNDRSGAHRGRQAPNLAHQPSCAVDQAHSSSAEAPERSTRDALLGGVAFLRVCDHGQLAIEVVYHDGPEQPRLFGGTASAGDVITLVLRLEFREDRVLGGTAVVRRQERARRVRGVGGERFEVEAVFIGSGEVQLRESFALLRFTGADEDVAPRLLPAVRLPLARKERHIALGAAPHETLLDLWLQLGKALKRGRDRALDAERIERADDLLGEEGALLRHLEDHAGEISPDLVDAGEDEVARAVRVMHIAGAVPDSEDLHVLCQSTEQGVIAPRAFRFLVVPDRRTLRHAGRVQHRLVEVQCQARRREGLQPPEYPRARQGAQRLQHHVVHTIACATDGGDIRQTLQAQHPLHHRVILVEVQAREPPVAGEKMHDQKHHHRGVPEGGVDLQVLEILAQPVLQPQVLKQGPEHHKTCERGRLLILETDPRQRADSPLDFRLAMLQPDDPLFGEIVVWQRNHTKAEAVLSCYTNNLRVLKTLIVVESCGTEGISGGNCRRRRIADRNCMHITGKDSGNRNATAKG